MTFSDLINAIDDADDGATVYVTSDLEFDAPLTVAKRVTITSAEGGGAFVIRPAESYERGTFMSLDSADADVTFANIVFDGQRGVTNRNTRELFNLNAGRLTLEDGAVIRNRYSPSYPAVQVSGAGEFVMEDGSEIRGIISDNYGIAVKTGTSGNSAKDGTFRMNGGLITECAGHHKLTDAPAQWDGAVYMYGGSVYAHGGTICGNTSDFSTAGVCNYYGNLYVSGSFTATNNVGGAANDVCRCREARDGNPILIDGDYAGHMTIKLLGENENPLVAGGPARFVYTSTQSVPRLGCHNIVSEDEPMLALDLSPDYIFGRWYPIWRRIVARVAGKTNSFSYWDALEAAESGDTILLCQDVNFARHTTIDKNLTITSDVGGPYAARRTGGNYIFATVTNATVTFKDIVLDGNNVTNSYNNGIVEAVCAGTIVLDSGTVIRRCVVPSQAAAVRLHDQPGTHLIMKDGALITECYNTGNGYGLAVCIGNGNQAPDGLEENPPVFEMRGGLITGCTCNGTSTPDAGYTGMVFLWSKNSIFDMSGGAITGNVSEAGCPGVVNYTGTVKLSGTAIIEGGTGAYPGIYNYGSRKTYYYGDFRGRVDVSNSESKQNDDQAAGKSFKVLAEDAAATGAWCFHAGRAGSELVGKVVDGTVVWAEPIGAVGGVKAASEGDLFSLIPSALDLNEGSHDRTRLPIVLAGAAKAFGTSVALAFDFRFDRGAPEWSLPLFVSNDGSALSGTWNFTLPGDVDARRWSVKYRNDNRYELAFCPPGMKMYFR